VPENHAEDSTAVYQLNLYETREDRTVDALSLRHTSSAAMMDVSSVGWPTSFGNGTSGYLEKKRTGLKVGTKTLWQKRWFLLRGDILFYYYENPDHKSEVNIGSGAKKCYQNPSGAISLANVSVRLGKNKNMIRIETTDGSALQLLKTEGSTTGLIGSSYELRAETTDSAQIWMQALQHASMNYLRYGPAEGSSFSECVQSMQLEVPQQHRMRRRLSLSATNAAQRRLGVTAAAASNSKRRLSLSFQKRSSGIGVSSETFGVGLDAKIESKITDAINKAGSDAKEFRKVLTKYATALEMVDLSLEMAEITPEQIDKDLSRDKISLNEIPFHNLDGADVLDAFKASLHHTMENKLLRSAHQDGGKRSEYGRPSESHISGLASPVAAQSQGSMFDPLSNLPELVELTLKACSRTGSAGDSYIFANNIFVAEKNFLRAVDETQLPAVPIKVTVGGLPLYHTEKVPQGLTVTIETDSYFELLQEDSLESVGIISVLHVQVLDLGNCSTMQRFLQVTIKHW
jgi:hypothetical protein